MTDNEFDFKPFTPPKQKVNTYLIIAGVVFAFAVIYFSLTKKEVFQEYTTSTEANSTPPLITESPINETRNKDVNEQDYYEPIHQDELLDFVKRFYSEISNEKFSAENYFSDNVIQYINKKNISPSEINSIHYNNNDFINGKSTIINNEINFTRTEGDINYYSYWIDFSCFRKSKNKFQNCKVNVEIGLDRNNKIKSYRELNVTDLNFTTDIKDENLNGVLYSNKDDNSRQGELGDYVVNGDENGRAFFYNNPNQSTKRNTYLVTGEIVYIQKIQSDYGYAEFTNINGRKTTGWLQLSLLTQKHY